MSAEAVGWVFRHSPYRGVALNVHLAIADSVNDQNDNELWMSFSRLATKARTDRKGVRRAVDAMLADGHLVILEDHRDDNAGRPSRYRMTLGGEGHGAPGEGRGMVPQGEGHGAPQTQKEPKRERETYSRAFEDAWAVYPRKVNKRGAWRAWKATIRRHTAKGDDVRQLLVSATRHYAAACSTKALEHIMHGSTFYGPDERWCDYLSPVAPQKATHDEPEAWMVR